MLYSISFSSLVCNIFSISKGIISIFLLHLKAKYRRYLNAYILINK
nr:MAG TPA: hypothetical protein [Caudoviricetes sp.]